MNAITYANLTTALESPSLIGMLMRAQTPDWPSGLVSMVVKQLFDKFEPQDTVFLIGMNCLKQQIGLQTPESNPQTMFEQIAALENQFKTPVSGSEKIVIAIEKLPAEYQAVLTAKLRKEGGMLMASHIENATFQYWRSVHSLYAKNTVINVANNQDLELGKEVALAAFNGTCNRCGQRGHKEEDCYTKKHINGQDLMPKGGSGQGSNNDQGNKNNSNANSNQKKSGSREIATIVASLDTRKQIVIRMLWTRRMEEMKLLLKLYPMAIIFNFCCVQKWSMG